MTAGFLAFHFRVLLEELGSCVSIKLVHSVVVGYPFFFFFDNSLPHHPPPQTPWFWLFSCFLVESSGGAADQAQDLVCAWQALYRIFLKLQIRVLGMAGNTEAASESCRWKSIHTEFRAGRWSLYIAWMLTYRTGTPRLYTWHAMNSFSNMRWCSVWRTIMTDMPSVFIEGSY